MSPIALQIIILGLQCVTFKTKDVYSFLKKLHYWAFLAWMIFVEGNPKRDPFYIWRREEHTPR